MTEIGETVERPSELLDLGFAEFDMLAHDRVVLLHDHLLGHGAGILLGHVEVAGVRRRIQADLDGSWLGHGALTVVPAHSRKLGGADNTNRGREVNSRASAP